MKKTGLSKVLKLGALGVLVLIVLVFTLLYMSKTELNVETNQGKGMESAAPKEMLRGNQGVEEETEHEGMKMEEEKGIETPQSPEGFTGVQITPEKQQLIGVKTDEAATRKLIKDIFVDYVGKYVKRGEPLFTVYSPDLVSTEEEYLLALKAQDSFGKSSFPEISSSAKSLLEATRRRLLLWDIP